MIIAYFKDPQLKFETINADNSFLLTKAVWIDCLCLTKEERDLVSKVCQIEIKSKEAMQEIEFSSRFYQEKDSLFMTVTMVAKSETVDSETGPVILVLKDNVLITIRYIEPYSFALFLGRLFKAPVEVIDPLFCFLELLESCVDRLADILENIAYFLEAASKNIFKRDPTIVKKHSDHHKQLQDLAQRADLYSKVEESLINFNRLITFIRQKMGENIDPLILGRLKKILKDIKSLEDYILFLSGKIDFLLESSLGLVNIEQNNIIKIFSIASVILLPPTLVASIYGMNFHFMPELSHTWGYPFALFLMALASFFPYRFFKWKGWF